jgi:hypothetical protein
MPSKIATKLAELAPTTCRDIFLLLKFVAPSLKDGLRSDGLEVPIMQNVLDAFHSVWCAECKKAAAEATANVHEGYRMACDILEHGTSAFSRKEGSRIGAVLAGGLGEPKRNP